MSSNMKLIINLAGNTLLNQHSDCNATAKILADESKCEFIVVTEHFHDSQRQIRRHFVAQ
ncbi:MAG: hypothetical protein ACOX37_00535 [Bacillota bacterium]